MPKEKEIFALPVFEKFELAPLPEILPEFVILANTYSFYAEDGSYNYWPANQTVVDSEEIKVLIQRRAPLKA